MFHRWSMVNIYASAFSEARMIDGQLKVTFDENTMKNNVGSSE